MHDILVTQLSDSDWRVADSRLAEDSPFAVIGFISCTPQAFEVIVYDDPLRIERMATFDDAVAIFVRSHSTHPVFRFLSDIDREARLGPRMRRAASAGGR